MENFLDWESIPTTSSLTNQNEAGFLWNILESSIQGILILHDIGHLVYANQNAQKILHKMTQNSSGNSVLPEEINCIFRSLKESRQLFPTQDWLMETKIVTDQSTSFEIQARWTHIRATNSRCLLLTMKDSEQQLKDLSLEEASRYSLTSRETDVWLLQRTGYTYKEIAIELEITSNTVKKHMKNILTKQHAYWDREG